MAPSPPDDASLPTASTLHTLRTALAAAASERASLLARCVRAEDAAARALAAVGLGGARRPPVAATARLPPLSPPPAAVAAQRRALRLEAALVAADEAARAARREQARAVVAAAAARGEAARLRAALASLQQQSGPVGEGPAGLAPKAWRMEEGAWRGERDGKRGG